jgi:hypothetical protein
MYIGLRVKYTLSSDFNEICIFLKDFQKIHKNIKFHENMSSGSPAIPWGWTDMTTLAVTFHNFANMPKQLYTHILKKETPLMYNITAKNRGCAIACHQHACRLSCCLIEFKNKLNWTDRPSLHFETILSNETTRHHSDTKLIFYLA